MRFLKALRTTYSHNTHVEGDRPDVPKGAANGFVETPSPKPLTAF